MIALRRKFGNAFGLSLTGMNNRVCKSRHEWYPVWSPSINASRFITPDFRKGFNVVAEGVPDDILQDLDGEILRESAILVPKMADSRNISYGHITRLTLPIF